MMIKPLSDKPRSGQQGNNSSLIRPIKANNGTFHISELLVVGGWFSSQNAHNTQFPISILYDVYA